MNPETVLAVALVFALAVRFSSSQTAPPSGTGGPIQCYQCDVTNADNCPGELVECKGLCGKFHSYIETIVTKWCDDEPTGITTGCDNKDLELRYPDESRKERWGTVCYCRTDRCNDGDKIAMSWIAFSGGVLVCIFKLRFY